MFTLHLNEHALTCKIVETYDRYNEYLEVSIDYDTEKSKIRDWHYRILTSLDDPLARWTSQPENYISGEALQAARDLLLKTVNETIPGYIKKGMEHPAWALMMKEADENRWPRLYKTDLFYHDALILGQKNPAKFVWLLRETGTHLLLGMDHWANAVLKEANRIPNQIVYAFNGRKLKRINPDTAADYLLKIQEVK